MTPPESRSTGIGTSTDPEGLPTPTSDTYGLKAAWLTAASWPMVASTARVTPASLQGEGVRARA